MNTITKLAAPYKIIEKLCQNYDVSIEDLKSPNRLSELVFPRHLAMYLIRRQNKLTCAAIGRIFNRDHTSVLHATTMIENYLKTDCRGRRAEILELINEFQ